MKHAVRPGKMLPCGERGSVAVEFALVVPLLLLMIFGIIEISVLLYDKAMITSACREGARSAIVYRQDPGNPSGPRHADDQDVREVVRNYCEDYLLNWHPGGGNLTVFIDRTGDGAGDQVSVSLRYKYHFLMLPSFIASLAGGLNLNATTVMRLE